MHRCWSPSIAKRSSSFAWIPGVQGSASLAVLKPCPTNYGTTRLMPSRNPQRRPQSLAVEAVCHTVLWLVAVVKESHVAVSLFPCPIRRYAESLHPLLPHLVESRALGKYLMKNTRAVDMPGRPAAKSTKRRRRPQHAWRLDRRKPVPLPLVPVMMNFSMFHSVVDRPLVITHIATSTLQHGGLSLP